MASLSLQHINKTYPNGFEAVKDFNLEIEDKEFIIFVGPSGCGKTTTLRIIAGLIPESKGQILLNGKQITNIPVYKRNFGMVFQSYALFPHLNVFDNVAFGLKMHKVSKDEIKDKVTSILNTTGLYQLKEKYPAQLSGGQQQRVSLARALVTNPQLLLMDEPLSNLDAKLRLKMREEIRNLQQKLKMTVLFVTHDQQECFAISDKVLIMKDGHIEQYDTPQNIFHHPRTEYVARFIGYDNFISINSNERNDDHHILVKNTLLTTKESNSNAKILTIRPENILLDQDNHSENSFLGTITSREYLGQSFKYTITSDLGIFQVEEARAKMRSSGDTVTLTLPAKHLHPLSE